MSVLFACHYGEKAPLLCSFCHQGRILIIVLLCLGLGWPTAPVKGQYHDDPGVRGSVPGYSRVGPSALSPLEVPKNQVLLQTGCHPGLQVGGKEFSQD